MVPFLSAHGYDPGPAQRPMLAGAIGGLIGTLPATLLLHAFGSIRVEASILHFSIEATLLAGSVLMALAGAIYSRLFGRAANDGRGGWLFGMVFGFILWAMGGVLILPLASGGLAPAGLAAVGLFLSLIVWGAATGAVLPYIHRPLQKSIAKAARHRENGPSASLVERRFGRDSPVYRR